MTFTQQVCRTLGVAVLGGGILAARAADRRVDFNRDVLPVLSDNCFACHGPDEKTRKARLRLDTRDGALRTKDPVIVPGKAGQSELIKRLTTKDPDGVMPPPDSKRKPTAQQIETLRRWIDQGAKWATHWAYVAPQRPEVPSLRNSKFAIRNSIDNFILARLDKEGLKPSPEAPRETLIRRVTLDLTGLPPTPEEVDAFLADKSADAYERLVDRLLKSPHYGERMAWDWLDAARYADSNGYQGDGERTMWPWRDWVVRAFNDNLPFDQFTTWQLAGDLLAKESKPENRDAILATAFNRNHMINGEGGRIAEENRIEYLFDQTETLGTVWLGVTIGCTRCHDHKFDPFTMRDYYGLFAFFNNTPVEGGGGSGQTKPVLDMATPQEMARMADANKKHADVSAEADDYERKRFSLPLGKERASQTEISKWPGKLPVFLGQTAPEKRSVDNLLECVEQLKKLDEKDYARLMEKLLAALRAKNSAANNITRVMVMEEMAKPRETFVLVRGAYDKPTDQKASAAFPVSLAANADHATRGAQQPLNRLDLARWLVSPENPLTARVAVNRAWQMFFGTGLVKTTEDFGVQGEKPSHPELLDWLATEFVRTGWDVKRLHKLIVMSAAYRQSSRVTPALLDRDPENRLLARGPRFRMPSWMLRDQALAASGLLTDKLGGKPVKPYQPPGIWEEATFGKISYTQDHGDALYRRSLYVFWRRIVGPTMFFDVANRQNCTVKSPRTNTPLHALVTLNETTFVEAARVMAERVLANGGEGDDARIEFAARLVVARKPAQAEKKILSGSLARFRAQFGADKDGALKLLKVGESPRNEKLDTTEHAAWTSLCSLLLNLDEAVSKE
ncbi:MAG: PSD1 domain-containing protein [Verrucomicrobia bacterium]|nr:PSD1 domain-containing protein [Verrucomicrobiota bacterium]